MHDHPTLISIAYKAELAASRRLARRTGITLEAALHAALEQAAGSSGLDAMVDDRLAAKNLVADRLAERAARKAEALALRAARHDGPPTPWRAWFDGSAHPNPGRCGIGALLTGPNGQRIAVSRDAGYGNSSQAEYLALIAVLRAAIDAGASGLTVYGDSRSVIDDVSGQSHAAATSLSGLRTEAQDLMAQIEGLSLRWVPRHKNSQADALSQQAVAAQGSLR